MSQVWVDKLYDKAGTGKPDFPAGLTVTAASFTGNVTIGGTLTYEDVTSIDSVGIVTARVGVEVKPFPGAAANTGVGVTLNQGGGIFAGICTATTFDGSITNIKGFNELAAPFGSTVTYTVKVITKTAAHRYYGSGSSSGYTIDGVESPFITLTPGRTYKFDVADSSNNGHPIAFYYDANKLNEYTNGVTQSGTAGNSGAYTQIVVSDTTPTVLHYQCENHALMGNAVQNNSPSFQNIGVITATTFNGQVNAGVATITTGTITNGTVTRLVSTAATVGSAVTITSGGIDAWGDINLQGILRENVNIVANKLSAAPTININNGMVHLFTTAETTTSTPNIVSTAGINTDLAVGDQISVSIIVNAAAAGYANSITIDGTAEGCHWIGGSVPAEGGTATDIYTFSIIKTGSAAYTVLGNQSPTS